MIFLSTIRRSWALDPDRADLIFRKAPADQDGDGARFQKFAFADIGEIDFIVSGHLTAAPFVTRVVEGHEVKVESIAEIIAKKVYYRGSEAKPRDIFDIAAAAQTHGEEVIVALRDFPARVEATLERLERLNPEFVAKTIAQLMVLPDFKSMADASLAIAKTLLREARG